MRPAPSDGCRRLLVTGASGFVGAHVISALVKSGCSYDICALGRVVDHAKLPIDNYEIDITDRAAVNDLIKTVRPTHVLHLASQSSVGQSLNDERHTWAVNFIGTYNLALALAAGGALDCFVFASTSEVYGASFLKGPASEDTPPLPTNPYSASKLAAELALRDLLPKDTRLVIARPVNHTGAGQNAKFALASFAEQIASIEASGAPDALRVGNLAAARDFLHVADVVAAYLKLLDAPASSSNRMVVNIGSGTTKTIDELLRQLVTYARQPLTIVKDPSRLRPIDIPIASVTCEHIRSLVDWRPTHSLDHALRDLLEGARAHQAQGKQRHER